MDENKRWWIILRPSLIVGVITYVIAVIIGPGNILRLFGMEDHSVDGPIDVPGLVGERVADYFPGGIPAIVAIVAALIAGNIVAFLLRRKER